MTPEEFAQKMAALGDKLPEIMHLAMAKGLEEKVSHFSNRVFKKNEDVFGNSFGQYRSEAYKDFRKSLGAQVTHKDLQLSDRLKDTIYIDEPNLELRLSTVPESEIKGRNKKIRANDEKKKQSRLKNFRKSGGLTSRSASGADKARGQELQLRTKIFFYSEKEQSLALQAINETFNELLKDAI